MFFFRQIFEANFDTQETSQESRRTSSGLLFVSAEISCDSGIVPVLCWTCSGDATRGQKSVGKWRKPGKLCGKWQLGADIHQQYVDSSGHSCRGRSEWAVWLQVMKPSSPIGSIHSMQFAIEVGSYGQGHVSSIDGRILGDQFCFWSWSICKGELTSGGFKQLTWLSINCWLTVWCVIWT